MRLLPIAGAIGALLMAASMSSAVTVTTFDNFTHGAPFANWASASATLTSGPTAFEVQATGYGGTYADVTNVSIVGTDTVQLKATVKSGVAGVIVTLGDTSNHEYNYAWYGNPAGDYTFTMPINSPTFKTNVTSGTLDLANIDYIFTQIDPGAFGSTPYDVTFNDLQTIATPEPMTFTACIAGGALFTRRRR